jgi:hypothetical protein
LRKSDFVEGRALKRFYRRENYGYQDGRYRRGRDTDGADAVSEIRDLADYVSPFAGGCGAVRDIIERAMRQTGRWDEVLALYGIKTGAEI